MRIAIFGARRHDRESFSAANECFAHALCFLERALTPETARLAEGHPAVCVGAEGAAHLGQQGVQSGLARRRTTARPQRLDQLVAGDRPVPVDDQVGDQQPALPAGQLAVQPRAAPFDDQRPADLDPQRLDRRQGHANIFPIPSGYDVGWRNRWPG